MRQKTISLELENYKIYMGGVSVKGMDKAVNQDAFRIGKDENKSLAYIIVADGLGSCKYSEKGSQKITDMIEGWLLNKLPEYARLSDSVANIMAKRIVEEWTAAYDFDEIYDYDTTVHLAVFYKGSLLIGGIGDGMALISYDGLVCKDFIDDRNLFSNITNSMCSLNVNELMEFEVVPEEAVKNAATVILSTDGIADDLISDKKLTLPEYFQEVIRYNGLGALQDELREWIEDWETEGHSDDKTLCYLVMKKEEE